MTAFGAAWPRITPRRPRHLALVALLACVLAVFVAPRHDAQHAASGRPLQDVQSHATDQRARETRERFDQAVLMLHAKQYEHAVAALQRVLVLAPRLPEAHVNLGFAWLGLRDALAAEAAFRRAIELKPAQANAYYGLAMALEQRADLPAALGAMRSYLHLSRADDPYRARARSALWEWEVRLGRVAARGPGPRNPSHDFPNAGKQPMPLSSARE